MKILKRLIGRMSLLTEEIILSRNGKYQNPKHIFKYPVQFYSQNYEDSIIAEIFHRIGTKTKTFLEIGIGDGSENNTRFLLEQGWSGTWLEADANNCLKATKKFSHYIKEGRLKIINTVVTLDNINKLVNAEAIDLLSLDIDMHTSHIWRALTLTSRVAVIEYNSSIHPAIEFEVKYNAGQYWDKTNYFGASLKTLEKIGVWKNMCLVGCDFHGINAFFVSSDEVGDKFITPYTAEEHFEPPKLHLVKHRGHPPA
jgi:hypothetical protein